MIEKLIKQAEELLPFAKDEKLKRIEKLMLPFPMAVFGTLRMIPEDQGNNRLMRRMPVALHCKGFLPHFVAKGIDLYAEENASVPVEIFFYDPQDWRNMISLVDQLEGIYQDKVYSSYNRTLVLAKVLPDDFAEEEFNVNIGQEKRNLKINPNEWEQFPSVPVWIYSNDSANADVIQFENNPILFQC